jgi:hypothetical protein
VEYFNFLGSITTTDTRCTSETKCRITMATAAFKKSSLHQQIALKFEEEPSKALHLEQSFVRY